MTKLIRRWGYSKNDQRIFEIPEGEDLPKGYYDSPAKVPADEPKKKPAKKAAKPEPETGEGE